MTINRRQIWIASAFTGVAAAATLLAVSFSVFAAASPSLLELAPADAVFIAGAQIDDAKASSLGQQFLLKLQQEGPLQQIKEQSGIDPTTDISEVMVAGSGPQHSIIAIRGNFQPADIFSKIQTETGDTGPVAVDYRGIQLLRGPSGNADAPSLAFGFLNASLFIGGTASDVEAAIDRWLSGGSESSPLIAKAAQASQSGQFWSVSSSPTDLLNQLQALRQGDTDEQLPLQAAAILDVLSKVTGTAGSLALTGEGIQLTGAADMTTAEDAQAVAALLTFVKSMAISQGANAPPEIQQHLNLLTNSASFTADGNSVNFAMLVPQQMVDQVMAQAAVQQDAPRQQRDARESRRQ